MTEKDNANLAIAVQRVTAAFAPIYNARLIDPREFIRLVYRFVGEDAPETIGEFKPINLRGGTGRTNARGRCRLPNKDPSDPSNNDLGSQD